MQSTPRNDELTLAPDVLKAVTDAFEELRGRAWETEPAAARAARTGEGKSFMIDPFAMMDSLGMGYRASPASVTYDTLRMVSERNQIVAAIMATRVNQVASFSRPQRDKYQVGFVIRLRNEPKRRLSESEKHRAGDIERFVLDTGIEYNLGRDSFDTFLRKVTRDSLTYDQLCFEKVKTRGGRPHTFFAVPSDTYRIVQPKITKGTPPDVTEAKRDRKYVQLINGEIQAEFTMEELAFAVRNPRTGLRVFGYGFPEIEQLVTTITSHLWAEEWNRRQFSQGSTIKGVLNFQGNIPTNQFEAFKRQWYAQIAGINNAWKTPVVNTEGMSFIPMQMSNVEMGYQMWIEYLIKVTSAIFQIDPAEINFDLRGGSQQQPLFMSNNEAQQKVSKDRGLAPLLRFLEDTLNRHIVWAIDPRFELAFVGLDAKTEDQAMQLRMQQVQNIYTLNEVRAMEDLPKLKEGDVVLNPTYTGVLAQKQQSEMQQQMMGAQGGAPGGAAGGPPGAGGPPPGPAGGGGDDPEAGAPSQPYAGRFQGKQPGEEEKRGAENIRQFHEHQDRNSFSSADDDDSEETKRHIHLQDWDEDVSKALHDESIELYTTLE